MAMSMDVRTSVRAGWSVLSSGEAVAVVGLVDGRSAATTLSWRSPARLFAPRVTERSAWLIGSTMGGGLVTGDHACTRLEVEGDARALYTTIGSTKAYRGRATQSLEVRVAGGALAAILPDPLVPFRDADVEQSTSLHVAHGGSLALLDIVSSGRLRHGERWAFSRWRSRLTLEHGERLIGDETALLDAAHGEIAPRAGRFEALGTLLLVGPLVAAAAAEIERAIEEHRPRRRDAVVEAASRLTDGSLLVRCVADDEQALVQRARSRLGFLTELLGDDPFTRRGL